MATENAQSSAVNLVQNQMVNQVMPNGNPVQNQTANQVMPNGNPVQNKT